MRAAQPRAGPPRRRCRGTARRARRRSWPWRLSLAAFADHADADHDRSVAALGGVVDPHGPAVAETVDLGRGQLVVAEARDRDLAVLGARLGEPARGHA